MTSAIHNLDKLPLTDDNLNQVRQELLIAERASGIDDSHTETIRVLQKRGLRLVHSQGHLGEVVAFAISPNGRHLATGSWVSDDYERGGMIQIWDIEMGRCVNTLDPIEGGVGWPEYPNCLSWTADGEKLGVAYYTNSVGLFDPFGESAEAIAHAAVTDGWSRPPAFRFLPDGEHAFIGCWLDAKVPGALVTWKKKTAKRSKKPAEPSSVKSMGKTIPEKFLDKLENEHLEPPKVIITSPDGARVYCINSHSRAFAINLATGELDYVTKIGLPAAYSPDGRFLAHTLVGLVIYDGQTGLPTTNLPMHMGMNALQWGTCGKTIRLAGMVSSDNEFHAEPGVHIYDDCKYRYSIDVKPREPSWDDADFQSFAWAPSGERAAVLDEEGCIHIVTLGQTVEIERSLTPKENLRGVFWAHPEGSSRDVIIAGHRECVLFIDADTGEVFGDHTFLRAPESPRPLDTGEMDLADRLRPDPSFAVDEETWGAAFPEGVVIVSPEKHDQLDRHLAWAVDRRFALPMRWGGVEIFDSAAAVAKSQLRPAGVKWTKFKPAKTRQPKPEFPPPNPPTFGPLYDALLQSMADLGRGWWTHIAENLRHAAVLRARNGEIAEALKMIDVIPDVSESLYTGAYLTAIAYRKGHGALVEENFQFVVEETESEISAYNEVLYAMALFAGWSAKKDESRANAWLTRAKAKLEPEVNAWQYRLQLIWNLVEAGRLDEARALFTEKTPWAQEPLSFYSVPFVAAMVREGHYPLLTEFLGTWASYRFNNIDWSVRSELGWLLARHGLVKELEEGQKRFGVVADEDCLTIAKSREKTGFIRSSPSPADIETLAADFAHLQKTPRARRAGGTRALIQKAASMGHVGAIVALLPDLPATNFNDRPQAALSALWTVTTGFDIVPW